MAFMDHIIACNHHDLSNSLPFRALGRHLGWVRQKVARDLAGLGGCFSIQADEVVLDPDLADGRAITQAIEADCLALARQGRAPFPRGEHFKVADHFPDPPLFTMDRNLVSLLGLPAYGIHVNGFVRGANGQLSLWIAKRAADRAVAPGKLDNMIAGGQPAHLTLMENLCKEAAEEADIPTALARTARPVGAISYRLDDQWGLKPDTMFCFDLDVPPNFTPRNTDGEIESFALMPVDQVAHLVESGETFKFNVNLVLIDFLIRHGVLHPDHIPDYADLVAGLRP